MFYHWKSHRSTTSAFTLIELLVVVLILGILIAVAIPLYLSSVRNAGTRTVQTNVRIIAQAAQAYKVSNVDGDGTYPDDLSALLTGGDLTQQMIDKPTGLTYAVTPDDANNTCVVTASESIDVFGDADQDNTLSYDIASGVWTPGGFTL